MTNRNSLSGNEIMTGDTIIMPMASRMFDTIRSITTNGRNSRNPISKAAVSSLTMKAGTSTTKSRGLTSAASSGPHSFLEVCTKKSVCSDAVWRTMNSLSGSAPFLTAV